MQNKRNLCIGKFVCIADGSNKSINFVSHVMTRVGRGGRRKWRNFVQVLIEIEKRLEKR